jgi:hypothetical protein
MCEHKRREMFDANGYSALRCGSAPRSSFFKFYFFAAYVNIAARSNLQRAPVPNVFGTMDCRSKFGK